MAMFVTRQAWISFVIAVTALLGGCSKTIGGYPNHAPEPSLVAPATASHDDKAMYMDLVRQMQQQGAYYASLAHIDAYRQRYGDTPELRRRQADALRETGQHDAAREIYHGLLHGDQAAPAWHGLGLIEAQAGHDAAADEALLKASKLEPVNAAYLSDLGFARLCAGRYDEAQAPLAMAAELDPSNPKVVSNLALWALLTGDSTRADAIMQRASLPPSSRAGVRQLALELGDRHRQATSSVSGTSTTTGGTQRAGEVPASMLQRFTPLANQEARP
ncbi:Flp pilus assembly protein TadD [Dyella amyloliquefaciens]|uniref:Flp pilus assembly protein TadD n=1 Tax=Dyella amyloliquefaciens TaxID=1770545 RepID=UPI00102E5B96|nr:Flp pilus assembly protein TadD [Dyella amyloliquefaciens]